MSTNLILEDEVRRDGNIKSVCGKKSRKKERNPTNWKKNVMNGHRFTYKKLPTLNRCNHDESKKSVFKCDNLNMQDIRKFHQAFYASCDKITRDAFLLKYINNETPTRPGTSRRKETNSFEQTPDKTPVTRVCTNRYFVPRFRKESGKHDVQVCKKKFLDILGISKHRVQLISRRNLSTHESPRERRGGDRLTIKYSGRHASVKKFIESLEPLESHYCGEKGCNRNYLSSDLSVNKLWLVYNASASDDCKVKYEYLRNIFNREYSISFKTPATDVCSTCLQLKDQIKSALGKTKISLKKCIEKNADPRQRL